MNQMAKAKIMLMFGLIFTTVLPVQANWLSRSLRQMFTDESREQCECRPSCRTEPHEQSPEEEERAALVALVCLVIGGVVFGLGYKLFGDGLQDYWPAERAMFALGVIAVSLFVWCCSVLCRSCSGNRVVERLRRESMQRDESSRTGLGQKRWLDE